MIIISSSSLINIPEQFSYLSSALNTDQLISEGSLKHLFSQNNLIEIPPIISSTSISTDNCRAKGVFEINGIIDKSIDTDLSFYIKLENQDTSVRCKLNSVEANYKAYIYCDTFESINNINISSKIIYDMNYNELFYLNETKSSDYIYCANNDQIKLTKAQSNIYQKRNRFRPKNISHSRNKKSFSTKLKITYKRAYLIFP